MYDCGFGDCFRISNDNMPDLYVDFGIHKNSMTQSERYTRYDYIIKNMQDKSDLLLTHYHEDHYAGAVYMMQTKSLKSFGNVYISDVWGMPDSVRIVKLLLLRGAISQSVLSNGLYLIQFLHSICNNGGKIYFVKRGSKIQDKYIALWPDVNILEKNILKVYKEMLADNLATYAEYVDSLAKELVNLANEYKANHQNSQVEDSYENVLNIYKKLLQTFPYSSFKHNKNLQCKLAKFGNSISVVFNNIDCNERNILFAGDVSKSAWQFIEHPTDDLYLKNIYEVIKIPHHGTKPYYHDFSCMANNETNFLIPNGRILRNWYIDKQYSLDVNRLNATTVCADNKACLACKASVKGCFCNNRILISSQSTIYYHI